MTEAISLDQFRTEARTFLQQHCERRVEDTAFEWGKGSDRVAAFEERSAEEERLIVERAKAWRGAMFTAGFGWITGPTELGGRGLARDYQAAFNEVASEYRTPDESPFIIGLGMVAPTIQAHAMPEVVAKYLQPLWSGEIIGCQLFSEPVAGSDLAGIQTKAVRDGDEWVLTGQKVWTSGAQFSDIGEIITRTSPEKPKHRGMTMFLINMKDPGIEIRPLRQMTGGASFNEVFLNEVRVHDSHRLGGVDDGWGVALTTLMNERMAIGAGGGGGGQGFERSIARLVQMARHFDLASDLVARQKIANYYVHARAASLTNLRHIRFRPAICVGKLANGIRASMNSGWSCPHSQVCMPPIDVPITRRRWFTFRPSVRRRCWAEIMS